MRLVSGLLLAAAAAILFLGCGSTEEASQPQGQVISPAATSTPTPTPVVTPKATVAVTTTAPPAGSIVDTELGPAVSLPPPTPLQGSTPIPDIWNTFSNSEAIGFSFRYPDSWYSRSVGRVTSWDPDTRDEKPFVPPGGMMVEVQPAPLEFAEERPPEATDTSLGGNPAWEVVYGYDGTAATNGLTRVHVVAVDISGHRLFVTGFFAQQEPDESIFLQILQSLELEK